MPLACLTLLVPKLFRPDYEDPEAANLPACPALAALFARGRFSRHPWEAPEAVLARLFGHAAGVSLGALRRRGESAPPVAAAASWIAADPVHLSFQRERLILADGASLSIAPEESAELVADLNGYFADFGVFHAASPERWYLRPAGAGRGALERIAAPPLSAVAGRSVERQLAEVIDEREIGKLLNGIQTFLHAHPVNRQREKRGLAPINSLWLWGSGTPPASPVTTDFDGIWSSGDPLARGLARAAGIPSYSPVGGLSDLLTPAASAKRPLVVLEDLIGPVDDGSGEAGRQAVALLEARWFAPAWRALTTGAIGRLRLVAPTVYGTLTWDAGRAAPWCFWRRRQTLTEMAQTLAASSEAAA
jgi:hypothetical protein